MSSGILGVRGRTTPATIGFAVLLSAMTPALVAAAVVASPPLAVPHASDAGAYFDHLVIIILENHNLCQVLTSCGGTANYLSSFAIQHGLATRDHYCTVNPSLPNYLCLTGGSDFGCAGYDGSPNSNGCTGDAWHAPNIVDRLESAGLSWKAYMEDMPSDCYGSDAGLYIVHHNPFVYYNDVASSPARCRQVVPAGSAASNLIVDLGTPSTAPNFLWFTPNNCHNMHSCSVSEGDVYLSDLVPKILASPVFTTTRAALFITFDEGYDEPIFTVWAGPAAKTEYKSSFDYNHYSFLATLESNWNLAPLTANDRDAPNLSEFFVGQEARPSSSPVFLWIVIGAAVTGTAILAAIFVRGRRRGGPPPKIPR
jgi:phosphatidylinositol-3-phosphatase